MKRVVITGGRGVLGAATAAAFEAAGDRVFVIDRAPVDVELGLGDIDLSDPAQALAAFAAAQAAMGGVEVLVNIAGGFVFETLVDGAPEAWAAMFSANLATCANMCRSAAPKLVDGGAIINIGAAAASQAGAGMGPYAAAKAGVARLTESLAAELAGRVRVNAVLPLILDTPQNRRDMPQADPRGWTAPAAVADVILFLASGSSRAINGALLPVAAACAA